MRDAHGALGALGLVLALLVAGCTDDPEPKFADPTPTASAPITTEPTSEPTTPEPTRASETLSPEETVRAWVTAFNVASSSGDTAALRELSTADCLQCNQLIDGMTEIYSSGGFITSDGWRVDRLKRQSNFNATNTLDAVIDSGAAEIVPKRGAKVETEQQERLVMNWTVSLRGRDWRVSELAFLS